MMIAAVPADHQAGEVAVDLPGDTARPAADAGVAGLAAVDFGLVVTPTSGFDLGHDRFPEVEHASLYSGARQPRLGRVHRVTS
jgi:hypothetical protein